jgi:hypothetical protein
MNGDDPTKPSPHWIPAAEWAALGPYVADLLSRLRLTDWTITIDDKPLDVDDDEGRKRARIELCHDWAKLKPDRKRHTLIHELIHCHEAPATDIIRLDLPKHLGQTSYDILFGAYKRQIEYMTDGLADAIAPLMPEYPSFAE